MIGFSEEDYMGDEGDVSRPNTPCTVTVEIYERSLEIPLQIQLTPREGNATSRKVETHTVPIYYGKICITLQIVYQCKKCMNKYFLNYLSRCETIQSVLCCQNLRLYPYVLHFTLVSVVTGGWIHILTGNCRFCYICHRKL